MARPDFIDKLSYVGAERLIVLKGANAMQEYIDRTRLFALEEKYKFFAGVESVGFALAAGVAFVSSSLGAESFAKGGVLVGGIIALSLLSDLRNLINCGKALDN